MYPPVNSRLDTSMTKPKPDNATSQTPADVREQLVDALRLDLVGPGEVLCEDHRELGNPQEILSQRPSTWYLTGFLVPQEADASQRMDEQSTDELDQASDAPGADDGAMPEPAASRVRFLPSSIGVSLLVAADATSLEAIVRWGDYRARKAAEDEPGPFVWERKPRIEKVAIELPAETESPLELPVPRSPD